MLVDIHEARFLAERCEFHDVLPSTAFEAMARLWVKGMGEARIVKGMNEFLDAAVPLMREGLPDAPRPVSVDWVAFYFSKDFPDYKAHLKTASACQVFVALRESLDERMSA